MNTRDLPARIRRLKEIASGIDIELMALALGCEPLTAEEHRAYRAGLEQMAHGARAALVGVQTAAARLEREGERAK